MDYSKFYTPPEIARALINKLCVDSPQKIVDICCGSCNLLFASKKRWPEATLYGVDVADLHFSEEVIFEKKDGRQFAIEHPNEFSLVVANPPFGYVYNRKEFPYLFVDGFEKINTSRLEIEMLLANLKLLQSKGVLLIIMPSSLVEAETHKKVRKIIAEEYYIESIIKLDESTFGPSRINSYALIIHNERQNNRKTKVEKAIGNEIVYSAYIDGNDIKEGAWMIEKKDSTISIDIKRGNISSTSFITKGQPILHTAKLSLNWKPSKRYISQKIVPTVFAESGDIIVSRIGKSAGQWCVYTGEKIAISDCLYRIRNLDTRILNSIIGKRFDRELKGVATRYITISDFCCWLAQAMER